MENKKVLISSNANRQRQREHLKACFDGTLPYNPKELKVEGKKHTTNLGFGLRVSNAIPKKLMMKALALSRAAQIRYLKACFSENIPDETRQYLSFIGHKGGKAKSPAKTKAARINARKPRKNK